MSCEDEKPDPSTEQDCFKVTENFSGAPVLESTWQLLGFVNNLTEEEVCFPAGMDDITVSFDAYNRINIISLCNAYSGHYLLKGSANLNIGDVLFSLEDCISDTSRRWERECLQNLEEVNGYEITGDILTLRTSGSYDLKFRYAGENPIATPTCFDIENNVEDVDLTRNWIFLGFTDDEKHCKPDNIREMTLRFSDTNTIFGFSALNYVSSEMYHVFQNDSIDFILGSTLAYPLNDTVRYWDSLYVDILRDTRWYDIQGRKLKLYDSDKNSLVFVSEE